MSNKIKAFIQAARLRTLPLSLSGIILGSGIASYRGKFDWIIFLMACLTTILFQILSNFANDYGDGVKGTDTNKKGEQRAVASGLISPNAMKMATIVTAVLSMISAICLIFLAFESNILLIIIFLFLALVAIAAAIKYTVGKSAYGYSGLGDLFVFLFFGLLSVCGSYALFHHQFWPPLLQPAAAIGMLSMAVLNLNNMRDAEEDIKAGKITLAIRMGKTAAKKYHSAIIILPFLFCSLFVLAHVDYHLQHFAFLLTLPFFLFHLKRVQKTADTTRLDGELKIVALSTFVFSALLSLSLVI